MAGIKRESRGMGKRWRKTSRAAFVSRDEGGRTCWLCDALVATTESGLLVAERAGGDLTLKHFKSSPGDWLATQPSAKCRRRQVPSHRCRRPLSRHWAIPPCAGPGD